MLHSKRGSAIQIIHPSCNSVLCTPRVTVVQRFPSHQKRFLRTTFLHSIQPSYSSWPMRRPEPSQPDTGLFHQCPDPPGASLSQWLLTRPACWTLLRRAPSQRKRISHLRCGPPPFRPHLTSSGLDLALCPSTSGAAGSQMAHAWKVLSKTAPIKPPGRKKCTILVLKAIKYCYVALFSVESVSQSATFPRITESNRTCLPEGSPFRGQGHNKT